MARCTHFILNVILYCHYVRVIVSQTKLIEGSPCVVKDTKREINGTCTSLFKCTTAARMYLNSKFGFEDTEPTVTACSYKKNGEPIVCCTDCKIDDTEKFKGMVLMESTNTYPAEGTKSWIKCTEYYSSLPYRCRFRLRMPFWSDSQKCNSHEYGISHGYGGVKAKMYEFPHMALLGYGVERETAQWLCGGSIISERFILSAAHCASAPKLGNVTFAALGILKRTELIDYWRVYKIETIIKHPEYRSPIKYHDIMLLETTNDINFGRSILPICLDTPISRDNTLTATGWGRQGPGGELENHLQVMKLKKYNSSLCSQLFPPHRLFVNGYDEATQMCYGRMDTIADTCAMKLKKYNSSLCSQLFPPHRLFVNGYDEATQMCYGRMDTIADTCAGDSGGPLQAAIGFDECYYHIIGITSFGKNCGIPGNAGVYTRVRSYLPWIESIVWAED